MMSQLLLTLQENLSPEAQRFPHKIMVTRCDLCAGRLRKDSSCGTASCAAHRPSLRGKWLGHRLSKSKWLTPKRAGPRPSKRRLSKGPPTPTSLTPETRIPAQLAPAASAAASASAGELGKAAYAPAALAAASAPDLFLLPEIRRKGQGFFASSQLHSKEGLLRQAVKLESQALAQAAGEVRSLQMLGCIAGLLAHAPASWKQAISSDSKFCCTDIDFYTAAILRASWDFTQTPADTEGPGMCKLLRRHAPSSVERGIHEAYCCILNWMGAARA